MNNQDSLIAGRRSMNKTKREAFVLPPELANEIRQLAEEGGMLIGKCHERIVREGIPVLRAAITAMQSKLQSDRPPDYRKPKGGP